MTTAATALPGTSQADADRFQTASVTTVTAGHAVNDTYTAFLPPLLPPLIQEFSLTTTQAGLLSVFLQWPSVLQPFIGYRADRLNLRLLVILAPAVTGIAMSLLGIAPSYAWLGILLIIAGISSAGIHAVGPVIAGGLSGNKLGRGMGFWMVGGGLGYTIGPLILVTTIQTGGLQDTPWLMLGGLVTSAVLYFRLRDTSTAAPAGSQSRPWRQAVRAMQPVLIPALGITVARSFMSAAFGTYLPTFLSREGSTLWFAGAAFSVFEGAGMVGALTAGALSDRLGRRRVITMSLLVASPLMVAFLLVSGFARLPILIALGFTSLSLMPVLMALMQEQFPENRALANGIFLGFNFILQSTATVIMGLVGDHFGLRSAYMFAAIIPLVGLPLVRLLPSGNRRAEVEGHAC
jgi:FSR family fosmidomycin resistance protein-like MFS transporter